ncbi:MAG TPA: hypothetical protein PLM93_01855 [Sulfuricurvum sp.]|nr:MAG: hypothetical protein B7Y30_06980 [Campylobacterales bacterium 16-40-21]OZA03573.1 MAG: hypothetical protein B7X89_02595 [Sulfuricurvum sp. 17-40-25]HQS65914.1 hypothetical protein [Sulfuricurvum sp.]HQT35848.1 hypothetical protein [Sulfuricurvum sp.]
MFVEEKLDLVLIKIEEQQQLLELFIPDLRKKKNVASFLGITVQCLENWIKDSDSPMEEGVHYRFDSRGALELISSAIILLKRTGKYKNRRKQIHDEDISQTIIPANNLATHKILQKIGKISSRVETPKGDVL